MDRLLDKPDARPANQRLSKHMRRERDALFTFLDCPDLEAANWGAEQAIHPMVITRRAETGLQSEPTFKVSCSATLQLAISRIS